MKTSVKQLALMTLFLCISSAAGLQCLTCTEDTCSSQYSVNCSATETLCFALAWSVSDSSGNFSVIMKGCTSPKTNLCSKGSFFYSYNFGPGSNIENITCCDRDNCNAANISIPTSPAGSLQCYTCDFHTYECTANVTCNAWETCFQSIISSKPVHGCISENVCNPDTFRKVYTSNPPYSCCNTSNCNVPEPGLQCMTCSDSTCSSQHSVTCSKYSPMCYSEVNSGSYYLHSYNSFKKGCASPYDCSAAGSQFFSYTHGYVPFDIRLRNFTCCDTDNCNAADLSVPAPPAGSLQCYSCDFYTKKCIANVTCSALETCFHFPYSGFNYYGCASESLCNTNMSPMHIQTTEPVSCCNTTNCNVPAHLATTAPPTTTTSPTTTAPPTTTTSPTTTAPPTTTTEPTTVLNKDSCGDEEDCSVFSAAGPVLPLGLLLSLLGLFTLTHTLDF